MGVFLDTGVLFSAFNEKDEYHLDALGIYLSAFSRKWGAVYTSEYILDEVITLLKVKTTPQNALKFLKSALVSKILTVIRIDERIFEESCKIFEKYHEKIGLSFTDATTIAIIEMLEIEYIASFDSRSFDGILKNRVGEGFWKGLGKGEREEILNRLQK
jgi:hypothetical protein